MKFHPQKYKRNSQTTLRSHSLPHDWRKCSSCFGRIRSTSGPAESGRKQFQLALHKALGQRRIHSTDAPQWACSLGACRSQNCLRNGKAPWWVIQKGATALFTLVRVSTALLVWSRIWVRKNGVADGIALASLLKNENKVTVVLMVMAARFEGDFHEAINVAAVWDLPM